MNKKVLVVLVVISAVLAMVAQALEHKLFFVLKPLTTVLIIALAMRHWKDDHRDKTKTIVVALCFCLLGDVFLLEETYFVYGLSAFLVAHLLFAWVFLGQASEPHHSLPIAMVHEDESRLLKYTRIACQHINIIHRCTPRPGR